MTITSEAPIRSYMNDARSRLAATYPAVREDHRMTMDDYLSDKVEARTRELFDLFASSYAPECAGRTPTEKRVMFNDALAYLNGNAVPAWDAVLQGDWFTEMQSALVFRKCPIKADRVPRA